MLETTAIYDNRIEDKSILESKLKILETGDKHTEFYIPNGQLLAKGYNRIVYGDHGPYIEFDQHHFVLELKPKFGNTINYNELSTDSKYYYYWLQPINSSIKVYLQIKPVTNLPNAPRREDGKKSNFNRTEGYADYKRGKFYINPYDLELK